ncbi:MAG TPA: VWA domain-containing protein [Blastocatellia bacterium]|nr:VWA domain-containing protein [Blastocatellia bacterium]
MNVKSLLTRFSSILLVAVFVSAAVPAQSGRNLPPTKRKDQDDTIRLRAEEVLLNITVIDPYNRQATDLTQNEFIIAEDNQRQDIASFIISRVPVNVVLMLDASGSIVGEIESLRQAAMRFIEQLGPEDSVSIIEFHSKVELIQEWTSNQDDIRHAISWRFKPGMERTSSGNTTYSSTALYDALYLTAEEQLAKVEGRKAAIILTDGDDTSSKVTYEQSLASVIRSGAVIYVVSKARAMMTWAPRSLISRLKHAEFITTDLATRTGGKIFSPLKDDEMKDAYAQVARELKNQYIITYIPKNEARDGRLRRINVYLTRAGYSVRTRDSYYAPKN